MTVAQATELARDLTDEQSRRMGAELRAMVGYVCMCVYLFILYVRKDVCMECVYVYACVCMHGMYAYMYDWCKLLNWRKI
jgi:hypothetical protein